MDISKTAVIAMALSSIAALPFAAHAQSALEDELQIAISGEIEPRCELTDFSSSSADFSVESSVRLDFNIYCNLEMSISLTSENGGLVHETRAGDSTEDPLLIRQYTATLAIDAGDLNETVRSKDMIGGLTFDLSETVVFSTSGHLDIKLDNPVAGGYAGTYSDQIRVTVSPSLATLN